MGLRSRLTTPLREKQEFKKDSVILKVRDCSLYICNGPINEHRIAKKLHMRL
jgi:hypothetical protein